MDATSSIEGGLLRGGPTNFLLSLLPLIVFSSLHLTIPPLRATIEYSWIGVVIYYAIAVAIFLVIRRRLNTVRDHEFHRSKAMQKMKVVYKAEEEGVWDKEVNMGGTLSIESQSLYHKVGTLSNEVAEIELDSEEKVEVSMLSESKTVLKATGRLYEGNTSSNSSQVGTVGATRVDSPMDRFLDFIGSFFGRDSKKERQQRRITTLESQAAAKPVIAQRPVAPLKSLQENDDEDIRITSYSDTGGIDDSISSSGVPIEGLQKSQVVDVPISSESIESMAMMTGQKASISTPQSQGGNMCRACGSANQIGERFCLTCGIDL
jgi:hypothetical protein